MIHQKNEDNTQDLFTKITESYAQLTNTPLQEAKKYKKGALIFKQGAIPRGVYYIRSGWVKIFKIGADGNEKILRLVTMNQFIGYLSLIKRWNFRSSAIAVTDCEVYFIPKQIFLTLLAKDNNFAALVVEMLADELAESETHIDTLLCKNVQERLTNLLLGLEQASDSNADYDDSLIRLPKKELAGIINITPETLSRHLMTLEGDGLINNNIKHIELLNRSGLLKKSNLRD
tara:strand:- start:1556 stop:2248 length:693 start_codon:yes stop_codon:yes gene_type:complete